MLECEESKVVAISRMQTKLMLAVPLIPELGTVNWSAGSLLNSSQSPV